MKKRNKRYSLTPEEKQDDNNADTCWICGEQGFDNSNKKVCLDQEAYCLKCAVELADEFFLWGERVKGTNGRQKTYEIFHVYCIFYSGFRCQTTVIFGITKDGSLVLNTLAS